MLEFSSTVLPAPSPFQTQQRNSSNEESKAYQLLAFATVVVGKKLEPAAVISF